MGVRIELEIGDLVFTGASRTYAERAARSFERELTRLLRERPPEYPTGGYQADLLTGLPPLPPTSSARRFGVELARHVHAGLADLP